MSPVQTQPSPANETPKEVSATSPLRMWGYVASLALLAFIQAPGRIVADTKIDLALAPWQFLVRATNLWDGLAAFGQLQNQAYGYLWPMGPFFVLGDLVTMPAWITERLWWTLLLSLAFVGVVKLAKELDIGSPLTQVAAAYFFVLSPRVVTLLGASSVELWPTALIPWVLLVVVRATRSGSVVRGGAVAALLVVCAGGVNATAASATIPLGVLWILTRAPGPRRWRLLLWWGFFTLLGTLWWLVPLVLLGSYSAPFLDYIETAAVTSSATDAMRSLLGVSNWVAYLDPDSYPAGARFLATPFLMLNTALLVGLGAAGAALRGSPHRRFLVHGLVLGMVLVGLGYAGEFSGWEALGRQDLLDAALSPLRNTHKYDGVMRLVLVLGLARVLHEAPWQYAATLGRAGAVGARAIVVVVIAGLAFPWTASDVGGSSLNNVPGYWRDVASFVEENSSGGTALLLPAATFGEYTWGSTRDDVMQPLARSPWAARNVIPLAEPGNVIWLDGVTSLLEQGHGTEELTELLQGAGVDQVVLRNDLDRARLGTPDPAYVRSVLMNSPGISLAKTFGPIGGGSDGVGEDGARVVRNGGAGASYHAVEVFDVAAAEPAAEVLGISDVVSVVGSPGSVAGLDGRTRISPSDASDSENRNVVVTDTARRRETAFQDVRWNSTATLGAEDRLRSRGPEAFHRTASDDERWQTTAVWDGVDSVSASSSQADLGATLPLDRSAHPGAAFDRDPATAWRSARGEDPEGAWLQVNFSEPTDVGQVSVQLAGDSAPMDKLEFSAGGTTVTRDAPGPLETARYELEFSEVTSLRIAAKDVTSELGVAFSVAEVVIDGVEPRRLLATPRPPESSQVRGIELTRDIGRSACVDQAGVLACQLGLELTGEDGDSISRVVTLDQPLLGTVDLRGSLRRSREAVEPLAEHLDYQAVASEPGLDVAQSALAMLDGDSGTTWAALQGFEWFDLSTHEPTTWDSLKFWLSEDAAGAMPTRVKVSAGKKRSVEADVEADGLVELPGWRARTIKVDVLETERVVLENDDSLSYATAAISELTINGEKPPTLVELECGEGPQVQVGGTVVETSARAELSALLRGDAVDLVACADEAMVEADQVELGVGSTTVLADPTEILRVDRISIHSDVESAVGADQGEDLQLRRDGAFGPSATHVFTSADQDRFLVLNQNYNRGWSARIGETLLEPVRINSWQQAWRLPAGTSGRVDFTFGPQPGYRAALVCGALLVLVIVAVVVLLGRRRDRTRAHAGLVAGPVGVLDVVLLLAGVGLVGGWLGVGLTVGAAVLLRRYRSLDLTGPVVLAVLGGALPLLILRWRLESWSNLIAQLAAVVAVALVVGAVMAEAKLPRRR